MPGRDRVDVRTRRLQSVRQQLGLRSVLLLGLQQLWTGLALRLLAVFAVLTVLLAVWLRLWIRLVLSVLWLFVGAGRRGEGRGAVAWSRGERPRLLTASDQHGANLGSVPGVELDLQRIDRRLGGR